MAMIGAFIKQPEEVESYSIDYSKDLTQGDNVKSAVITVTPTGLTVRSHVVKDPKVRIWLSGGVNGESYKVTCTVTTEDGRVLQDEFRVKIKDI